MPRNKNDLQDQAKIKNGPGFINPYNFVEFGRPADRGPAPSHEKFSGLSGRIECEISLISPICIPDAETSGADPQIADRKIKKFSQLNGKPFLPASEIKGMVRSVAEAVSGSCLSILNQQFYVFRDNRSWITTNKKIGSLQTQNGTPVQLDAPAGITPNTIPDVFPRRGLKNQNSRSYNPRGTNFWKGNRTIPQEVSESYHYMVTSDDFALGEEPKGMPPRNWRDRHVWDEQDAKKWLVDYDQKYKPALSSPYWWFRTHDNNPDLVIQIGRNFRFKWAYHTLQSIPAAFQPCEEIENLCPTCRLFGWTADEGDEDKKASVKAVAGRVKFSPATWIGQQPRLENVDALKILNTPKPSCRSFYLRPSTFKKDQLSVDHEEYLRMAETGPVPTRVRGRKFFWHHTRAWNGRDLDYLKMKTPIGATTRPKNKLNSDIEVLCPPENKTAAFKFEVNYENLNEQELGLLIWSLALPEGDSLAHHIGLGKPLGLGSIKVTIKQVTPLDRKIRYEGIYATGETAALTLEASAIKSAINKFREVVRTKNNVDEFLQAPNVADLVVILDTRMPAQVNGTSVKMTYPPGFSVPGKPDEDPSIHPEDVHHKWFGVDGWQWSQRLLTIQEVKEGKRQLP